MAENPLDKFKVDYSSAVANPLDKFKVGYAPPEVSTSAIADPNADSPVSDAIKQVAAGATKGLGMAFRGGGELLSGGINAAFDTDLRTVDPLQGITDKLQGSLSTATKDAIGKSQITGDILDPSTYNFGEAPSVRGIGMQGINALGQLIPQLGVLAASGGASIPVQAAVEAGFGLMQGIGGGVEEQGAHIEVLSHAELYDRYGFYKEQIDKGVQPGKAKANTKRQAEMGGGLGMGLLTSAEQALENAMIRRLTGGRGNLAGKSRLAKSITGGIGGGLLGGTEEVAEGAAARIGSNILAEGNQDLTENSLGDFVMGAIAEGPVGGGVGYLNGNTKKEVPPTNPQEPKPEDTTDSAEKPEPAASAPVSEDDTQLQSTLKEQGINLPIITGKGGGLFTVKDHNGKESEVQAEKVMLDEKISELWGKINENPTPEGLLEFQDTFPNWYAKNTDNAVEITDKKPADSDVSAEPVKSSAVARQKAKRKKLAATEEQSKPNQSEVDNEQQTQTETTQADEVETSGAEANSVEPATVTDKGSIEQATDNKEILDSEKQVSKDSQEPETVTESTLAEEVKPVSIPESTTSPANVDVNTEQSKPVDTQNQQDVDDKPTAVSEFTPTHELQNGTPVIATDEENIYADENGDEWEESSPTVISAPKPEETVSNNADDVKAPIDGLPDKKLKPISKVQKNNIRKSVQGSVDALGNNGNPKVHENSIATRIELVRKRGDTEFADELQAMADTAKPSKQIESAASEAALSPKNDLPEPSDAQKEAGNYKKGHLKVQGLDIAIENPKGSVRKGVNREGKKWSNKIKSHYGYIKGTVGNDKDHVDVFMSDDAEQATTAYIVDQVDPDTGDFDEHKVMIGYADEQAAKKAYLENYDENWQGLSNITEMPISDFNEWVRDPKNTTKPAAIKNDEGDSQKKQQTDTESVGSKKYKKGLASTVNGLPKDAQKWYDSFVSKSDKVKHRLDGKSLQPVYKFVSEYVLNHGKDPTNNQIVEKFNWAHDELGSISRSLDQFGLNMINAYGVDIGKGDKGASEFKQWVKNKSKSEAKVKTKRARPLEKIKITTEYELEDGGIAEVTETAASIISSFDSRLDALNELKACLS